MEKIEITMTETRITRFTIEAHDTNEGIKLVKDRIALDDGFCDKIEEMYECGIADEVIEASPASADAFLDYTYAEMTNI